MPSIMRGPRFDSDQLPAAPEATINGIRIGDGAWLLLGKFAQQVRVYLAGPRPAPELRETVLVNRYDNDVVRGGAGPEPQLSIVDVMVPAPQPALLLAQQGKSHQHQCKYDVLG